MQERISVIVTASQTMSVPPCIKALAAQTVAAQIELVWVGCGVPAGMPVEQFAAFRAVAAPRRRGVDRLCRP